jgi:hypothetical protein
MNITTHLSLGRQQPLRILDTETSVNIHQLTGRQAAYGNSNLAGLEAVIVKFMLLYSTQT